MKTMHKLSVLFLVLFLVFLLVTGCGSQSGNQSVSEDPGIVEHDGDTPAPPPGVSHDVVDSDEDPDGSIGEYLEIHPMISEETIKADTDDESMGHASVPRESASRREGEIVDYFSVESSGRGYSSQASNVKAASHDDNEEYFSWLKFMQESDENLQMVLPLDYSERCILRVLDSYGAPVMNQQVSLQNSQGETIWEGITYANGETVLFPKAFFNNNMERCHVAIPDYQVVQPLIPDLDGICTITLTTEREPLQQIPVDIAFVLDGTGSMSDEIQQLKDVLFSIHARLQSASQQADFRFAIVLYRDVHDDKPLEIIPFTGDVDEFEHQLAQLSADGGGDTPEDLQQGLYSALYELEWRDGGIRAAFVIADAPPHTDYEQQFDYNSLSAEANRKSIRIHCIGASGLDASGEYIFRQIAATSYGQFIFLTYGETGESDGLASEEDPGRVSHHTGANYNSRRLDDIVVDLIRRDLSYQIDIPLLTSDTPDPESQSDMLSLRLENLWEQITHQIELRSPDSLVVVLLPFDNQLQDSSLSIYLHDLSIETIVQCEQLSLVERERLADILQEHGLVLSGLIEPENAMELGNLLNSDVIFMGRIYRLGTDRIVHVRAVEAETAQIIAAARVRV